MADRLDAMNTCRVLAQAASNLQRPDAKVYMDSGVENLNKDVDALFSGSALQRIIAQIRRELLQFLDRSLVGARITLSPGCI